MKMEISKPILKSMLLTASLIEARDAYTGGHLWRVSQYCRLLSRAAGMPERMVFLAGLGGFLHDIGKISIPDNILGKPDMLTESEFDVVKTHPGIGATLIQSHPMGKLVLGAVHQHHEWTNGSGYPDHLQGGQISIYARIVSIADAFDALTSARPYHPVLTVTPAVQALKSGGADQFDAALLDSFMQLIQSDSIREVLGNSEPGIAMVSCPSCGPVMAVTQDAMDGDFIGCRVCGSRHRLHRDGGTFMVEFTGAPGTAEELKPSPEMHVIDTFVETAPLWIEMQDA